MSHRYTVIKASSYDEALKKSPFFVGQRAKVYKIWGSANGDGTYSLFAEFELTEEKPMAPMEQVTAPQTAGS